MKSLGIIGSLVMGVAIFLVVTSSAAATSLTSLTGTTVTPTIKAESEGHVELHNSVFVIECGVTLEGKIESHGKEVPASGNISALSIANCTDGWVFDVSAPGSLAIKWTTGYNGAVTSSGMTITGTGLGLSCHYRTENTQIGTITGGSPATIHLAASIPRHGGNFLCGGSSVTLTGNVKVGSPSSLFVDEGETSHPPPPPPPGTTITSPTGTTATPAIKAEGEGHVELHNSIVNIDCSSLIEGKVESHGPEASALGKLSTLSFASCTNGWVVDVVSKGSLAVDWSSGYNGTVTSSGMTITGTRSGLSCHYKTENTQIGTIAGGTPATIHLKGSIPRHGGSFLCGGASSAVTGSYKVSSPSAVFVDGADPVVTSPTGTVATPAIKAASEGHLTIDHPIASIQCNWSLEGTVESHLEGVVVPLTSVTTSSCTDSWHATTVSPGKLEVTPIGGYDGTVVWNGGTVEMTRLGTTCRYKTEDSHLGTITGGSPATIDVEGDIAFHSGSPLCGEEAYPLTGSIKVNSPSSLYFD